MAPNKKGQKVAKWRKVRHYPHVKDDNINTIPAILEESAH